MKKSFALLLTLFIVVLFSYVGYHTLLLKTLKSHNQVNVYLYEQAHHHQLFFKNLLLSMPSFDCQTQLTLKEGLFTFHAKIEYVQGSCSKGLNARIDTFIQTSDESLHINLHERFIKKL